MPKYTPEQAARVRAILDEAMKGQRPRRNKFARAADTLGNVADEFDGADRDQISQVIHLLETRAEESGR